jgi:toxin ParE1/3/4
MAKQFYRVSNQALADLYQIANYLGTEAPNSADAVLDEIHDVFQTLSGNTELGTERDDLSPGLRMFVPRRPAQNYVILYYTIGGGVEISDVIHAARDWVGMFRRGERGENRPNE